MTKVPGNSGGNPIHHHILERLRSELDRRYTHLRGKPFRKCIRRNFDSQLAVDYLMNHLLVPNPVGGHRVPKNLKREKVAAEFSGDKRKT